MQAVPGSHKQEAFFKHEHDPNDTDNVRGHHIPSACAAYCVLQRRPLQAPCAPLRAYDGPPTPPPRACRC